MADIRTIGIKFDPAPAKAGAETAKKAVADMAQSVGRDLKRVEGDGKKAGTVVKEAGAKIETSAKGAAVAVEKLGRGKGFQRMATDARGSLGQVSRGVIDMLDTFGLMDSGIGRMVRRVQSGISSVAALGAVMKTYQGAGAEAVEATVNIGAAMTETAEAAANLTSAGTEVIEMTANLGSTATEGIEAITNLASAAAEAAEGAGNLGGAAGESAGMLGRLRGMLGGVTASAGALAAGLAAVVAVLALVAAGAAVVTGVLAAIKAGIPKAAAFEDAETGFAVLLGSFDAAAAKMAEIKKFAAATPFESAEMIQGARYLETFTAGLLNNEKGWRLVGDAASAAQRDFGEVAMWTGRMYAALKGGQPIGEATMRLMEMGLITPQVKGQMDKLAESSNAGGKNFAAVWGIAETSLKRFGGTMDLQSKTWNGLMSSLADNWNLLLAGFAKPVMEALKPALAQAVELLGSMIPYAVQFGEALARGVTFVIGVFKSGEIAQALQLGLLAAFEFARAAMTASYLLAFNFLVQALMKGIVMAVTLPIRIFSTVMQAAIGFVSKLMQGDLSGAIAVVVKYFGDGGMSAIKMMAAMVYNALGQAFVDVVNTFRNAIFAVLQKAGDIASNVLVKAGKDPLAPIVAPPQMKFVPKDTSFSAVMDAANAKSGTGAREDFSKFIDDMIAKTPKAEMGNLPAPPDMSTGDPMADAGKAGGAGGAGADAADKIPKALAVQGTELQRLAEEWRNLDKQIDATAAGAVQSIAGGMTNAMTGLIMGTTTAKAAFTEMATSIVTDIIRMILQMQIQLALAAALKAMGVTSLGAAHSGGTVGATNLSTTGGRTVLPTYHSGGMATSEQAVKVERGESILTRKRAKELEMELSAQRGDRSGQQRGGGSEATIINVFDRNEIADAVVARPDAVVNAISRQLPAVRKMVMSGQRL